MSRAPAAADQAATRTSPGTTRIAVLDVARGVAILGTLATNIWIFTDPAGMIGMLLRQPPALTADAAAVAEWLFRELANGKFLGMLTLMFGIGLAIQQRSAQRRGERWPGRYPWRATLLLIDGVLHYVLVVEFDVLMGYAVTGMIVAVILARTPRAQRFWLWSQGAVHVLLLTVLAASLTVAGEATRSVGSVTLYTEGSWWQQVLFRLENPGLLRAEPLLILPLSIVLFLLGAKLFRAGLFEPHGARIRRTLLVIGAVALPIDLAVSTVGSTATFLLTRYGTAPLVALGLLGAVAMLVERRRRPGFAQRRLAEIGRMALSCYVLQNIVASALCYGWGLGLASRLWPVQPWGTLALFAVLCTVVAAAAHLWLRFFDKGPLEALWARLYALPWRRGH